MLSSVVIGAEVGVLAFWLEVGYFELTNCRVMVGEQKISCSLNLGNCLQVRDLQIIQNNNGQLIQNWQHAGVKILDNNTMSERKPEDLLEALICRPVQDFIEKNEDVLVEELGRKKPVQFSLSVFRPYGDKSLMIPIEFIEVGSWNCTEEESGVSARVSLGHHLALRNIKVLNRAKQESPFIDIADVGTGLLFRPLGSHFQDISTHEDFHTTVRAISKAGNPWDYKDVAFIRKIMAGCNLDKPKHFALLKDVS